MISVRKRKYNGMAAGLQKESMFKTRQSRLSISGYAERLAHVKSKKRGIIPASSKKERQRCEP
jgi:hypothetical protein